MANHSADDASATTDAAAAADTDAQFLQHLARSTADTDATRMFDALEAADPRPHAGKAARKWGLRAHHLVFAALLKHNGRVGAARQWCTRGDDSVPVPHTVKALFDASRTVRTEVAVTHSTDGTPCVGHWSRACAARIVSRWRVPCNSQQLGALSARFLPGTRTLSGRWSRRLDSCCTWSRWLPRTARASLAACHRDSFEPARRRGTYGGDS